MTELSSLQAISERMRNWQIALDREERAIDTSLVRHDKVNIIIDRMERRSYRSK